MNDVIRLWLRITKDSEGVAVNFTCTFPNHRAVSVAHINIIIVIVDGVQFRLEVRIVVLLALCNNLPHLFDFLQDISFTSALEDLRRVFRRFPRNDRHRCAPVFVLWTPTTLKSHSLILFLSNI